MDQATPLQERAPGRLTVIGKPPVLPKHIFSRFVCNLDANFRPGSGCLLYSNA